MTRVGIIGSGHIGSNIARFLARAGHDVLVSFSQDQAKVARLAAETSARTATPAEATAHCEVVVISAEATAHCEVVVISVPWGVVDTAIEAAGGAASLAGKTVIDTTNQFGQVHGRFGVLDLAGKSAAETNAAKVPEARWVKAFNTLTAGFQASSAGRTGPDRVVLFYATNHDDITSSIESLIEDAGFDPVRTGTLARVDVGHQEPQGDLYGEEFHHDDAVAIVAKLRGTPPSGTGRP